MFLKSDIIWQQDIWKTEKQLTITVTIEASELHKEIVSEYFLDIFGRKQITFGMAYEIIITVCLEGSKYENYVYGL